MKITIANKWRLIATSLAAVAVGQVAAAIYVLKINVEYAAFVQQAGEPRQIELVAEPETEGVIAGAPVCGSARFGASWDEKARSGLWQCDGPATMEFHYGSDETVYVLEGGAEIDYLGRTILLEPGSTVLFAAGTRAVWTVPERIKKVWLLHDPGGIIKRTRRLIGQAPGSTSST